MNDIINANVINTGRLASRVLSASTLNGDDVYNPKGEKLGSIKELMLDIENGKVCYAVLSFGGFLSLGEKLFAVPWSARPVDAFSEHYHDLAEVFKVLAGMTGIGSYPLAQ